MARDKAHLVAMTGSYLRGDAEAVLHPDDESRFDTVTYTYYEQLNGYQYLKQLDIGYYFYAGSYTDEILRVLDPAEKTILHIPNVNSRESTKDKIREVPLPLMAVFASNALASNGPPLGQAAECPLFYSPDRNTNKDTLRFRKACDKQQKKGENRPSQIPGMMQEEACAAGDEREQRRERGGLNAQAAYE